MQFSESLALPIEYAKFDFRCCGKHLLCRNASTNLSKDLLMCHKTDLLLLIDRCIRNQFILKQPTFFIPFFFKRTNDGKARNQ